MSILCTGSLAYDYIMNFPDSFKNHILPDQLHILNVSFTVDTLHKNLGGCAGNMAHTINLLGGSPTILGIIGTDGDAYLKSLKVRGISTDHIHRSKKNHTASAHITTDKDDNQITAFHIGAIHETKQLSLAEITENPTYLIVGPNQKEAMIKFSKEASERNIPIVLDPGQMIPMISAQEMQMLVGQATYMIANDYEMKLIEDKTGWDGKELLNHVDVLITTLGEKGSVIATKEEIIEVGHCPALSVEDPTGAGDAYRGGFFTALSLGKDLKTAGQVGAVAATYAVEQYATQHHTYTIKEFAERYERAFGEELKLSS